MRAMKELDGVTRERFEREVVPAYEPVVMRGVVAQWPLVAQAHAGLEPCLHYLMGFDRGEAVDAVLARPEPTRAFSYRPGLDGFNFTRDQRPYAALFEQLWRYSHFPEPPSLAAQSALVSTALPGLERANALPLLDAGVAPRIWIGNRATVPAHFDDSHNIACVAAGARRFTLLPPQCAPLLYLGPPDYAPTPAPMSVVPDLHRADPAQFPLLAEALAQAAVAELEPGDAIYIPPLWFHQVEALAPHLNILMNYWWRPAPAPGRRDDLHLAAMRLAMLALRHLPDGEREGWRALLSHYVFGAQGEALAHIPEGRRHMFGELDAEQDAALRKDIAAQLKG
ncbi:cupin-like domain-containing protein [Roseateles saccharophilus]|uniref:Cupin-like protein n=1 Tax=Roseateles saccharophilus TaxID=304 RepID=A0A4R3UEP8_ROSSA|nr:cupin-like domain-containing protein [Roseateles saccharophilus]MDG0835428.1 cupin-like domain-containing protein [Roseateles saccharophilus]TCU86317.1 cupin-like protein [Roseateles saccharophilus]